MKAFVFYPHRSCRVLAILGLLALTAPLDLYPSTAFGHGEGPAALEVLSVGEGGRPQVVRTNIGLALYAAPETYHYGCPSAWNTEEKAPAAASADALLLGIAGTDGGWVSRDGGCHFERVDAELDGEWMAVDVVYVEPALFFAMRRTDKPLGGSVWRVDTAGQVSVESLWSDLRPDAITSWQAGEVRGIAVTAAKPSPALRAAQLGDAGLAWEAIALDALQGDVARVEMRAARDGEVWLLTSVGAHRSVWRGVATGASRGPGALAFARGQMLEWSANVTERDAIHGPAYWDGAWWAIYDAQLFTTPPSALADAPDWSSLGFVDWACLYARGAHLYTCSMRDIEEILGPAPRSSRAQAGMETAKGFALSWIAGPQSSCEWTGEEQFMCEADWVHYGAEAGLFVPDSGGDATAEPAAEPGEDASTSGGEDGFAEGGDAIGGSPSSGGGGGGCHTTAVPWPGFWLVPWVGCRRWQERGRRRPQAPSQTLD